MKYFLTFSNGVTVPLDEASYGNVLDAMDRKLGCANYRGENGTFYTVNIAHVMGLARETNVTLIHAA